MGHPRNQMKNAELRCGSESADMNGGRNSTVVKFVVKFYPVPSRFRGLFGKIAVPRDRTRSGVYHCQPWISGLYHDSSRISWGTTGRI